MTRVASLMQGSAKEPGAVVVWHRTHRSKARRSPKGAKWRTRPMDRHTKETQQWDFNMRRKQVRMFKKWKGENPKAPNHKNPFRSQPQPFKTNAFALAFEAAGIHVK